jgi:hypothetical protein
LYLHLGPRQEPQEFEAEDLFDLASEELSMTEPGLIAGGAE